MVNRNEQKWASLESTPKNELEVLEELCNSVKAKHIIDLGCFIGGFTQIMAKVAKKNKGMVYSIDVFKDADESMDHWEINKSYDVRQILIENMESIGVMEHVDIIVGKSSEVWKQFIDESIDLIFIDATHTYKCVIEDISCWYGKIRNGGIICGHDYNLEEVEQAVNDLFSMRGNLGHKDNIWYYRKES